MWPRACARLTNFLLSETEEGVLYVKLHLPISSLCLGEVLAKTISSLLKTIIIILLADSKKANRNEKSYFDPIAILAIHRCHPHE